jgi:hypothetical protein
MNNIRQVGMTLLRKENDISNSLSAKAQKKTLPVKNKQPLTACLIIQAWNEVSFKYCKIVNCRKFTTARSSLAH